MTRTTHNLQLNLHCSKPKGGESSKPGSQQSTARNIPKGAITFHNKQLENSKEYDSKNSKTKRKKEHPTFFEVKPSQITLSKAQKPDSSEPKQTFINFLNKAPLPKPSPSLMFQKQDSVAAHSDETVHSRGDVSSLLQ